MLYRQQIDMREYTNDLIKTKLFSGIEPEEIDALLDCIHARRIEYAANDFIIEEGNKVYDFGILLSGHAQSIKWDATGRIIIITLLEKGSEIGVMIAASMEHKSPVSVQVLDAATVLMIPYDRVLARCEENCLRHDKLLNNYIHVVAEKGIVLHERIDCLLKATIREKIMAYLTRVSREQQSRIFSIPLNRNAMAEYLNMNRSVLSNELSKMKQDRLIDYHKNSFKLL